MRLMHILGGFGPGGAEMGVIRLIRACSNNNLTHSVCIIGSNIIMKEFLPEGTNLYSLDINGKSYSAFALLYGLFKRTKAGIVHVNNLAPWFDVLIACKLAGCKCIETFHGVDEDPVKFSIYRRSLLKTASLFTSGITAVANSAKDLLVQLSGINEDRIKVIPNGIDSDLFSPPGSIEEKRKIRIELNLPQEGFLIACVAGLRGVKDHWNLIKGFAVTSWNKKPGYLILVGDGPLECELKSLSKELGIENRVIFMGNRKDVGKVLKAMDTFVLNSKTEGMSYAILEAMATSLPIIATNVGANKELVDHGRNGFLYPSGDLRSLSHFIETLASDETFLSRMGQNSRDKVLKSYSLDRMVSAYKNLYEEVFLEK